MRELTIPAKMEYLEELLRFVDDALIAQSCPAILRLRSSIVVEEIFDVVRDAAGDREVDFTCRLGATRAELIFEAGQWHKMLQMQNLEMLLQRSAARGVGLKHAEKALHMGLGMHR